MLTCTRLAILFLFSIVLPACGPSSDVESEVAELEKKNNQAPAKTPNDTPPAPPLTKAPGPVTNDVRAEIILLVPDVRVPMHEFQRNGLAMLVGRQAGYMLTTKDAAGSSAQQIEQFRQAIAAKPAAIIVEPIDPPALAALIVEAQTAGVIVIGLDKRMLKEGCASIVYSDQRLLGRMAADTVIEALKRKATEESQPEVKGRVVQLRGAADDHDSAEMAEGFSEGLRTQPGVILVHDTPADWSAEAATQRTAEAFRLQKNFDVIYAHNDAIAVGAAKAAEAAGQRESIFIIGTDGISGQKKGMELVREGEIDATIVRPALVDLALQIVVKLRADKTFKPEPAYEIQPVAVVPKNVEQSLRVGTYKLPRL
ncbi:substrate-binding domain-containing protein [Prosthecobacter sp.]|uniref:sugar ABC transporter substrate-binding protein n=1 Tax=Prosthecobacter sp. TaxID=1965333 RepID=UPI001D7A5550|nr:substrate-binding domain-containing protein [Prosthecobacter sp.]MCB1276661.1 substrate-binding domain-containing protein [Prosthecobacter sp.]